MDKLKGFATKYWFYLVIFAVIMLVTLVFVWLYRGEDVPDSLRPTPTPPVENDDYERPSHIDAERFRSIDQPIHYNDNFDINIKDEVLESIRNQPEKYSPFYINEINRFNLVETFVDDIGRERFEYSVMEPEGSPTLATHLWEDNGSFISYVVSKNQINFRFEESVSFPTMSFEPTSRESVTNVVEEFINVYLNLDLEYSVEDFSREGDYYRIEFNRTLNNVSVYRELGPDYIVISPNGNLKSGSFIVSDFREYPDFEYRISPADRIRVELNTANYPRNVSYIILDEELDHKFGMYGYSFSVGIGEVEEDGVINIDRGEVVYLYEDEQQEVLAPAFLFKGDGFLRVEGENYDALFTVVANAIDLEYVD